VIEFIKARERERERESLIRLIEKRRRAVELSERRGS